MSFRQRNNDFERKNTGKRFSLLPVLLVVFLILIFSFSGPRNLLFDIASPLWNVKDSIASFFADNIQLLQSKSALIQENISLKNQIAADTQDNILAGLLQMENEDLKNILQRTDYNPKEILAAVLVKPTFSPFDTLIIDIGTANGISVGDKVVASSTFVGYVSQVYSHSSKVTLYSSPGEKIPVLIGSDAIEEEAVGMGGGNFSLQMPIDSDVKVGDYVSVPSISPNIFAVVNAVEFKETDSVKVVLFESLVNISELKWVEVIPADKSNV